MSILDLITEADELLEGARDELELLLLAVDEQRRTITNLEDELHGLRLTAARKGEFDAEQDDDNGTVVAISSFVDIPRSKAKNLDGYSRSDAVLHVLTMSERALDRQEVLARLETLGRRLDSVDQISLALTNLKRSGRAVKVGDGRWRAALSTTADG